MKTKTFGFRSNDLLIILINIMAAQMGKNKSEFIEYCILTVTKGHNQPLYDEYKNGDIKLIGDKDED